MVRVKPHWRISQSQVKKGTNVELEHTRSRVLARKIALDHLREHPRYYDYLEKMEKKMKKDLKR